MRAVVDIGSNSVKFSRADFFPPQEDLELLESKSWITRLGKGVGSSKTLQPASLEATAEALKEMNQIFAKYSEIELRVVATSAVRDATNSYEVHKMVKDILGANLYVIPGYLEAELSFSGARFAANKIFPDKKALFVDVGGASTEVGTLEINELRAKSFQAGGVRCMEALGLQEAPVKDEDWKQGKKDIAQFFPAEELNILVGHELPNLGIGIGGSLMAAAEAAGAEKKLDYGFVTTRTKFETFNDQLRRSTLVEREQKHKIEKGRSDIVCTGILCLTHVLEHFRITDVFITKWGLRHGIFLNWNHPFFRG